MLIILIALVGLIVAGLLMGRFHWRHVVVMGFGLVGVIFLQRILHLPPWLLWIFLIALEVLLVMVIFRGHIRRQ